MDHQRDVLQVQTFDERLQVRGVGLGQVGPVLRLVGQAEADMIGGDAAVADRQVLDQAAVQEGPRGRPVDEQDGLARALVDVVHPAHVQRQVARLERVLPFIHPVV
uniref:Uncharacterized protein n=1 Tax=uncultured Armatimonadetes bacterium TaxID=157466 RepID=A0A6J4JGT9_9BACT|nr:hypothetical protein AVDCRST_MAG63-3493 [uncultured Armatimonadetes bacterium]